MATPDPIDIGERVNAWFRQNVLALTTLAGISVRRAAGLADLSEATLRSWMSGEKDPTLRNLARLADALGVEPSDLLTEPAVLQAKVAEVGLRPFVLPRRAITSLPSSVASAAGRRKAGVRRRPRTDWATGQPIYLHERATTHTSAVLAAA